MKKLFVCLAVFAALAVPGSSYADTVTFSAPPAAPNTNDSTDNPGEGDYQGGARQFDPDHRRAYTRQSDHAGGRIPAGHAITGARLTFTAMANLDTNANRIFVSPLDSARNYSTAFDGHSATAGGVTWDANGTSLKLFTSPQAVPEPATVALLGTGLAGPYYGRRRQRQRPPEQQP